MWSLFLFLKLKNNMQALIGLKQEQSQRFLEDGKRIPVTLIDAKGNTIVAIKTNDKNNYQAIQLGFSMKKKASKGELGHAKGAKLEKAPKFLREVRVVDESEDLPLVGTVLDPMEIFEPGDIVDVSGFSKGKGFQGGVKRYGFHGGPKTHGQSDRHRAPGSIGQGTTPGRVYKGKRMAGNMGNENVTVKNLEVVEVTSDGVIVLKGLVPGIINGMIMVKKVGKDKNFKPLYKTPEEKAEESEKQTTDEATVEENEKPLEAKETEVKIEDQTKNKDVEAKKDDTDKTVEEIKEDVKDSKDEVSEVKKEEIKDEEKIEEVNEASDDAENSKAEDKEDKDAK